MAVQISDAQILDDRTQYEVVDAAGKDLINQLQLEARLMSGIAFLHHLALQLEYPGFELVGEVKGNFKPEPKFGHSIKALQIDQIDLVTLENIHLVLSCLSHDYVRSIADDDKLVLIGKHLNSIRRIIYHQLAEHQKSINLINLIRKSLQNET